MTKTTLMLTVLLLALPAAAAPPQTGNSWSETCASKDMTKKIYCHAYARGIADGLSIWEYRSRDTAIACIPSAVQADQLTDVGRAWIKANPKHRHEWAGWLLTFAFTEAWPCQATESESSSNEK